MNFFFLCLFSFLFLITPSQAQKVTYTTESIHGVQIGYNILGKINENYLVYIAYFTPPPAYENMHELKRDGGVTIQKSFVYIYDRQMQLLSKEELKLPKDCFAVRFISYQHFIYIFYQYRENTRMFYMAAKIDSNGKITEKPVILSEMNQNYYYYSHSDIYNLTYSEDKKRVAIFKIQETQNAHRLDLLILNQSLKIIEHNIFEIPLRSDFESFSNFKIDNEGNFFFLKKEPFNDSDPNKNVLNLIENNTDTLRFYNIKPSGIKLNGLSFAINNTRKQLNFFSFYADLPLKALWDDIPLSKARSKSGIYNGIWDVKNNTLTETEQSFAKILGSDSNNPELQDLPIQDFFVADIYYTKNGNFVLQGQNSDPYNVYKSFLIQSNGRLTRNYESHYSGFDRIGYSKIFGRKMNYKISSNLLLLSFDSTGFFTKFNFVNEFKAREFVTINTGNALHYFFFSKERNNYLIRHLSFTTNGGFQAEIPLKNDQNYKFALGYNQISEAVGYKQVSETELIFPVFYRGILNFAKIEF